MAIALQTLRRVVHAVQHLVSQRNVSTGIVTKALGKCVKHSLLSGISLLGVSTMTYAGRTLRSRGTTRFS